MMRRSWLAVFEALAIRAAPLLRRHGWWLATAWLALVPTGSAAAPAWNEGQPFMQHFTPGDYQGDSQCWSVVQDRRGLLYVANYGAALEYDGSAWRPVSVNKPAWVRSLAYDLATDTVFFGGDKLLGSAETLPGGERAFVSLLDQLPADARDFGSIYNVYATPAGVFFVATSQVMRWRDGRFTVWSFQDTPRLRSGWAAGSLYIHSRKIGLQRLEGDRFVAASSDPYFSRTATRGFLTGAHGEVLIASYHDGLAFLRDGVAQPWQDALNGYLKEQGILQAMLLRDGSLAIVTEKAGLLLLDRDGRFRNHVDNAGGLHGNDLLALCEDAEGGLWMGLESGLTRAEIDSPLSVLRAGPDDSLVNVTCNGPCVGTMIVGTLGALYRVVDADPVTATGAHLERLPGIADEFVSSAPVEDGLLLATVGKVSLLDPAGHLTPVFTTSSDQEHLRASRLHPGCVYVGEQNGHVTALQRDGTTGRWEAAGVVAQTGQRGIDYGIAESAGGDLWVGTDERGLFHVPAPSPGNDVTTTRSLLAEPGPLHNEPSVWIYNDGGSILFRSPRRLYALDERAQVIRPAAEYGAMFVDGSLSIGEVLNYDARTLWVTATPKEGELGNSLCGQAVVGDADRPATFHSLPRKVETVVGKVQGFLKGTAAPDKPVTVLVAGSTGNGLVRLDVARWEAQTASREFATLIRRAVTTNHEAASHLCPPILGDALPYTRNSAHFEYSADTFAFGAALRFQTRLVNYEEGRWFDFSTRNSVDYTNLPEGNYTFEARARNADGQLGRVASLSFRILPPWQRTWWAYALYALGLALGVAALVWWRGRRLRQQNAALEALVSTRTGELVHARDAAESANRAKSAFLANMSHELRTPLNAILGYSQIMAKHADLPTRTREQVQVVRQSGEHLLSLINEVLDLAKVEAGKLTLAPSDFSLEQLVRDAAAAFRPRLAEKKLAFRQTCLPGLPGVVHADVNRLRQVLFNLLGNAVKFTRAGIVSLEVGPTGGGWVRFEVGDTGVGIAADQLQAIFDAFHQTGEHTLATQGTGLGLAISQRLVQQMGGEIQVESTPGQGSRFWFELPLEPGKSLAVVPSGAEAEAHGLATTGYAGASRRLLVVDDQPENRRVLRDLLQPLGFELEEATDGAGCLAACARVWPDAVLLDLRLDGRLDGFAVARTLRTRAEGKPLGIIAVSASVFEDARQQAVASGCDDFLPKPFAEAQLLAVLGRVLGLRWTHKEKPATLPDADADFATHPRPPAAEVAVLLELAAQGDVVGIRRRLEALRRPDVPTGSTNLLRVLEPLVANYQMDQIYATLLNFRSYDEP